MQLMEERLAQQDDELAQMDRPSAVLTQPLHATNCPCHNPYLANGAWEHVTPGSAAAGAFLSV
mgnify:CR=1 FL=1